MHSPDGDEPAGFRLSNLIDLVFPRWKDAVIAVDPHDSAMGKAMRYYRVWIYVSCGVTVVPALIFASVVAWIFTADYFRLLPLALYDWTFLYLYAAIFFQIFLGPILGCIGALKLNERLLWAYWGSMVALCFGDAIIGVVWAFKFTQLNGQLLQHLNSLLANRYGADQDFTRLWDTLQTAEKCCGVENATDYLTSSWLKNVTARNLISHEPPETSVTFIPTRSLVGLLLPESCCHRQLAGSLNTYVHHHLGPWQNCSILTSQLLNNKSCYLALHTWMHSMGDILFVLGYSVIAFIRAALVFCLYNEIKHFIRKIYIRGVPREMHHASVSAGSDLANFHRNTASSSVIAGKARNNSTARDHSLRRWSFIRGWRGFRSNVLQNRAPVVPPLPASSSSTVKLKSICEETTTML